MFTDAYQTVFQSVYALNAGSEGGTASYGTAFAVAPGVLVTVAHVLYRNAGDSSSLQDRILVLRAPEVKPRSQFEEAQLLGADSEYDIALITIPRPRSHSFLSLATSLPMASRVGTISFPRFFPGENRMPIAQFQGGYVSSGYSKKSDSSDRQITYYETDFPMYTGSSG